MKTKSIKKRMYEKPTVRVYELHSRTMLLSGSDAVEDYKLNNPQDW